MGAHTNVTVPESFDRKIELMEKIEVLELQKQQLSKRLGYVEAEFQNVFEAIKKYGYVDLSYEGETIRLVQKNEDNDANP